MEANVTHQLTHEEISRVASTLEAILVPGKRARISPFVEATQFRMLFGEDIDHQRRGESSRLILEKHEPTMTKVVETQIAFERNAKNFGGNPYTRDFLDAYLVYYFTVAVPQVQLALLELFRAGRLPSAIDVLDIGVGPGTSAIAVLDFLVALLNVCDLHGVARPIQRFSLVGIDQNQQCLDYAKDVVGHFQEVLKRRADRIPDAEDAAIASVLTWSENAAWEHVDLNQQPPETRRTPSLIIASRVLNELNTDEAREHFELLLGSARGGGVIAILEPGSEHDAKHLMAWRRKFLARHNDFEVLGPCGSEFSQLPSQCSNCWSARRESLHRTHLYKSFQELYEERSAPKANSDAARSSKRQDPFSNYLLSWSYVLLSKSAGSQPIITLAEDKAPTYRFIGAYSGRFPSDAGPDQVLDDSYTQFLKLCPAHLDTNAAVIERAPGTSVPPLNFGVRIRVSGYTSAPFTANATEGRKLVPQGDGTFSITTSLHPRFNHASSMETEFLQDYGDSTRIAVDELAFRLFGFEALREFQHEIIGRALEGKNVLGIAATGGGKSECFILPAMLMSGITLVVSPLRALMKDQYDQRITSRYGLGDFATVINSDVTLGERHQRLRRMELGYYRIVYVTPEQLEQAWVLDSLVRAHNSIGIRYLAIDEAHCISHWGHDFRPAYLSMVRRLAEREILPTRIALTATASPNVREDICAELRLNSSPVEFGGDLVLSTSNRPELNLVVKLVDDQYDKGDAIVRELGKLGPKTSQVNPEEGSAAIVFMPYTGAKSSKSTPYQREEHDHDDHGSASTAGVNGFATYLLAELDEPVAIYHSKMDDESDEISKSSTDSIGVPNEDRQVTPRNTPKPVEERTRAEEQDNFMLGGCRIMVATKGFGMGIDKPNVRLVIHRSPPENLEAYAQEAGRAGRDGKESTAVLLFAPSANERPEDPVGGFQSRSDFEIQDRFIRNRVIRSDDVGVMRAFLRDAQRKVFRVSDQGRIIYATNDEMIAYFENCTDTTGRAGISKAWQWPDFSPRMSVGTESDEHRAILNIGHSYNMKTEYLTRVLDVIYRTIVHHPRDKHELPMIKSLKKSGLRTSKKDNFSINWAKILQSNLWFGEVLRNAELVEEKDFLELLFNDDLLFGLSRRIGLTPGETVSLLRDIEHADGKTYKGRYGPYWVGDLLTGIKFTAPRLGPAAELDDRHWLNYAGGRRETREKAYESARKSRRDKPTTDDWFPQHRQSISVGWQIESGLLLDNDDAWETFESNFLMAQIHRSANDRQAFERFLTEYIGVSSDGSRASSKRSTCLRATLLGYLRSGEVVQGGNCLSCSNCVPSLDFSSDMDQRRQVISQLNADLLSQLETLESRYIQTQPPLKLLRDALHATEVEHEKGNSAEDYLAGWIAKVQDETPGHLGALWIRTMAAKEASRDRFGMPPSTLARTIKELHHATSIESSNLAELVSLVQGLDQLANDNAEVHYWIAEILQTARLNLDQELALRRRFLELATFETPVEHLSRAAERILDLLGATYAAKAEFAPWALRCHVLLSSLAGDPQGAFAAYQSTVKSFSFDELWEELEWHHARTPNNGDGAVGMIIAWSSSTNEDSALNLDLAIDILNSQDAPCPTISFTSAKFLRKSLGSQARQCSNITSALISGMLRDRQLPAEDTLELGDLIDLMFSYQHAMANQYLDRSAARFLTEDSRNPLNMSGRSFVRLSYHGNRVSYLFDRVVKDATLNFIPMTWEDVSNWFTVVSPELTVQRDPSELEHLANVFAKIEPKQHHLCQKPEQILSALEVLAEGCCRNTTSDSQRLFYKAANQLALVTVRIAMRHTNIVPGAISFLDRVLSSWPQAQDLYRFKYLLMQNSNSAPEVLIELLSKYFSQSRSERLSDTDKELLRELTQLIEVSALQLDDLSLLRTVGQLKTLGRLGGSLETNRAPISALVRSISDDRIAELVLDLAISARNEQVDCIDILDLWTHYGPGSPRDRNSLVCSLLALVKPRLPSNSIERYERLARFVC